MSFEDRILKESRSLIERVEHDRRLRPDRSRTTDSTATLTIEESVDGSVEVLVADDGMMAEATFYPPQGSGRRLAPRDIYEQLGAGGVVHGILEGIIEATLFSCNTELSTLHGVEIAAGTEPKEAVPTHLRLLESKANSDIGDEEDRVDYRAIERLPLVAANDLLAESVPAVTGREGTAVTGKTIPFRSRRVELIKAGENTAPTPDGIRATIPGLVKLKGNVVTVSPTLVLDQGVDYHTGNIDFDGDVVLKQRIADDFTVSCSGTLFAKTTIDAFGITCGEIIGKQGLIGRNDQITIVTGDARLRFVQNARIKLDGSLYLGQSALKAEVTARERIVIGPGSTVIGSVLRAGRGADVHNIGSPGAAGSEVYLGVDFTVDERLAVIRDQTVALSSKLREIQLAAGRVRGGSGRRRETLSTLEIDVKAAIAALAEEAGELVSNLDVDDEAELIVRGTAFAGTYLEICHRSHLVEKTVSRRRYRIDKARGSIVERPLDNAKDGGTK